VRHCLNIKIIEVKSRGCCISVWLGLHCGVHSCRCEPAVAEALCLCTVHKFTEKEEAEVVAYVEVEAVVKREVSPVFL